MSQGRRSEKWGPDWKETCRAESDVWFTVLRSSPGAAKKGDGRCHWERKIDVVGSLRKKEITETGTSERKLADPKGSPTLFNWSRRPKPGSNKRLRGGFDHDGGERKPF